MASRVMRQKADRARRTRAGICYQCESLAVLPKKYCQAHLTEAKDRQNHRRFLVRYAPPKGLLPLNAFAHHRPVDLAYAAALIEGEGWIGPNAKGRKSLEKPYPVISIRMTDREGLDFMQSLFGGRMYFCVNKHPRQDIWIWKVSGRVAGAVVYATYPFYKLSRKQKAGRLLLKVASICGWWKKCTVDERGILILNRIRAEINAWNATTKITA